MCSHNSSHCPLELPAGLLFEVQSQNASTQVASLLKSLRIVDEKQTPERSSTPSEDNSNLEKVAQPWKELVGFTKETFGAIRTTAGAFNGITEVHTRADVSLRVFSENSAIKGAVDVLVVSTNDSDISNIRQGILFRTKRLISNGCCLGAMDPASRNSCATDATAIVQHAHM